MPHNTMTVGVSIGPVTLDIQHGNYGVGYSGFYKRSGPWWASTSVITCTGMNCHRASTPKTKNNDVWMQATGIHLLVESTWTAFDNESPPNGGSTCRSGV
ncbi:MAG: hypothetical protein KDB40_13995 [Acidimicrobiales bacterium]|nr:hypothetical protein [Acidimicrobiales bacterium]MCB9392443.1 hypothetical protein [Acidimicrobiaceae bacterium]